MRFKEPTRWELFLEGFHDFLYAWDCYDDGDYRAFWEALSSGWYDEYIYPYDDIFYGHIPSPERQLRLNEKPFRHTVQTYYVSQEDYDALTHALDNPPPLSPELIELLQRTPPWEESNES